MDVRALVFFAGLTVLVLAGAVLISGPTIQEIMRIRRTPTTPIGALPGAGRVEVVGKAGSKTIWSPVSETACVLWHVEIRNEPGTGQGGSILRALFNKTSDEPFELSDESGTARVLPEEADVILGAGRNFVSPNIKQREQIKSLGIDTINMWGAEAKLQYCELLILPGQEISVMGELQSGYGRKTLAAGKSSPLVISDRSKRERLSRLYWRVGMHLLIAVFIPIFSVMVYLAPRSGR